MLQLDTGTGTEVRADTTLLAGKTLKSVPGSIAARVLRPRHNLSC